MNYSSNDEAKMWADNLAESEGEAFEQAIKRISPQKVIDALTDENATLRIQIARLSDQNKKLREALARTQEEEYE